MEVLSQPWVVSVGLPQTYSTTDPTNKAGQPVYSLRGETQKERLKCIAAA